MDASAADASAVSPKIVHDRGILTVLTCSTLVFAAILASPMFRGKVPVAWDLGCLNLPVREFYAHSLRQGDSFDWMPQLFGGFYLTGEGQHGPYHPVHWLMYRWLPLDIAFDLEVFLPVAFLACGMAVFLRRYVEPAAIWMGVLCAAFSGKFIVHLQHPQMASVIAHLPWLLAAIDFAVIGSPAATRRMACAGIALIVASQSLLGHPQALSISLLTCSLFALWRLTATRACWSAWVTVIGGVAIGLCLAAVQLFPTCSMFAHSTRAGADAMTLAREDAVPWSFCQFLLPKTFSNHPQYVGAVVLVLSLWWLTAHRIREAGPAGNGDTAQEQAARQLSTWGYAVALLTFMLSFGPAGKFYCLLMWLPAVGKLKTPYRYQMASQIILAVLAALAFAKLADLVRRQWRISPLHLVLPWSAAVASLVAAGCCAAQGNQGFWRSFFAGEFFVGPLLMFGSAAAITLATRGRRLGLTLLVLLTVVDVGLCSIVKSGIGKLFWWNLPSYQEYVASQSNPPKPCEGRLFDEMYDGLCGLANTHYAHGFRMISGYDGFTPARCLHYESDINALRVAQVQAGRFWPANAARLGLRSGPRGENSWQTVADPLPRVRLLSHVLTSVTPADDLAKILVETTALVSHPIDLPASAPGAAELIRDRPGSISVAVQAPQRQLLLLSECYDPGWRVAIDGRPVTLERVNGDFFGCVVDGGRHHVEFAFRPPSLLIGKIVSLTALLFTCILALGPETAAMFRRTAPHRLA